MLDVIKSLVQQCSARTAACELNHIAPQLNTGSTGTWNNQPVYKVAIRRTHTQGRPTPTCCRIGVIGRSAAGLMDEVWFLPRDAMHPRY